MEYKITWLTLRLIPKAPVNREEFFKSIITALHLNSVDHKFVNAGGNRHYFSVAMYKGVNIKIPFYETMYKQGFVIEMTKEGLETVANGDTYRILELIRCFYSFIPCSSDLSFIRIDVETDYIPPKVLKIVTPERLKNYSTIYIGSFKSTVHCIYSNNVFTYVFRNAVSVIILRKLLKNFYDSFMSELICFLDNWTPREITCFGVENSKEPRPSSVTK